MNGHSVLNLAQGFLWISFAIYVIITGILLGAGVDEAESQRWGLFWRRFGTLTLFYIPFAFTGTVLVSVSASMLNT